MREDKHRRKFRQRPSRVGADLISKEAIDFDACETFGLYGMHTRDWKTRHEDVVNLNRADPFGIHDYFVDYSLNKKKRWTINEEIADRIEEVQDKDLNIRVSSSINEIDRSNTTFKQMFWLSEPRNKLPCLEYHTVSRDGKTVTHKKSESGRTRLRNFTHAAQPCRRSNPEIIRPPAASGQRRGRGRGDKQRKQRIVWKKLGDGWPYWRHRPRRIGRGVRARRYRERYDYWNDSALEAEENVEHQKLHIHYTTQKHSDRPSLHNRMSAKGEIKRPPHNSGEPRMAWIPPVIHTKKRTASKRRLPKRKAVIPDDAFDDIFDDVIDDVIISEPISIPTVVEDLSALVVRKEKRKRAAGKRKPLRRFVDEIMKTPFIIPTPTSSGYGSEEDIDNDDETPPTSISFSSPTAPMVCLPMEMFTRIPLTSATNLSSAPRLPCFPPAWEIHQKDSMRVLGKPLLTSVIARKFGEELRLSIVDDFVSTHLFRSQLPPSDDAPPESVESVDGLFCDICCEEMDMMSEDRLCHPFALSCSHLFCAGCWLSHISESIRRQKLPAACLDPSCTRTISTSAAKGLLASSSVEMYELATIDALRAAEKLTSCPECSRMHYTGGSLHISCPCGTSLCAHCSSIDHSPLGCDVFEQYNSYMKRSGFTSIYSSSSDAPLIRNLAKCPKCSALMQRSEGCNHMSCMCGAQFCYCCGKKWADHHYECDREDFGRMSIIDVSTSHKTHLLVPSLLTLAIESRSILIDRRKELRKRLHPLPAMERKAVEKTFIQVSLMVELCYLSSRRSRRAKELAERLKFLLDNFFHSNDKNIAAKARSLKELRESLIV